MEEPFHEQFGNMLPGCCSRGGLCSNTLFQALHNAFVCGTHLEAHVQEVGFVAFSLVGVSRVIVFSALSIPWWGNCQGKPSPALCLGYNLRTMLLVL